ncbi:pyrroline-5-carboxylate reductase [Candidatus Pelagibacter sp.]|jgi:pyrroline-5-carboxylate reductase|nr:pyrroline-5-carboxylate reductase [Candidatus Pelagibacter sp.]
MNIGFIGTGKIASSVIIGICKSNIKYNRIIISSRNKKIASSLKKKFKKVLISKTNQEIVDKSEWVFLSVTPTVGQKIIKHLKFRSNQKVISFISTITLSQLKKMIKKKIDIVRAIPLPPISLKEGPIPICPPNKKVKAFFDKLGSTIEIKNEKLSINFWSTSGMMASYYNILDTMSVWLSKKGIKKLDAQKYITSLFLALSKDAVINSNKDLKLLVNESQTPKGLNEQGLKEMTKKNVYKSITRTLNSIYKRLDK